MPALSKKHTASTIASIYIGLILGVSFFAAPIKFTADGVGMNQLLAVGKVTFQAFTWVEFVAASLLLATILTVGSRKLTIWVVVLLALLLIQKFGVLPSLDDALDRTVAGETVEGTNLHAVYVVLECVKLLILFYLVIALGNRKTAAG